MHLSVKMIFVTFLKLEHSPCSQPHEAHQLFNFLANHTNAESYQELRASLFGSW